MWHLYAVTNAGTAQHVGYVHTIEEPVIGKVIMIDQTPWEIVEASKLPEINFWSVEVK